MVDLQTARSYLVQEIESYLPQRTTELAGLFRYGTAPGSAIVQFQKEQGVADERWALHSDDTAVVMSWSSPGATFAVPRPRAGVDATLKGNTFLMVLIPNEDRRFIAIVEEEALTTLRASVKEEAQESLSLLPN